MRNLKKVITMTLAIAMMFGMTVMGTSAAVTFNDADDIENTTAVNMNVALNIINGDENGNFNPENTVTRAEMAKMISVALNGGVDPNTSATNAVTFTDTAGHWASGYIENLSVQGIIAGYTDGSFAPNAGVTATEAAKMLLVALGYDAANEGFENDAQWSAKITAKANAKGLYTDLGSIDPAEALSRDDAAQMVWNALQADMVYYDYELGVDADGNFANLMIAKDYTYSILWNKYGADEDGIEGTLEKYTYNSTKETYTYTVNDDADTLSFTTEEDYTALYGHNVKVIYKASDTSTVYGMFAEDSEVLFSGLVTDMDFDTDEVEYDDVDYDVDDYTTYFFSYGTTLAGETLEINEDNFPQYYTADALDTTGDGDIDCFMVYPFTVGEVTYVGSSYATIGGNKYYFDSDDIYDGIAKSDYAKITDGAYTITGDAIVEEVDDMLEGKITAVDDDDYYIDGVAYQILADASDLSGVGAGDTVYDAPVVNGFIFGGDSSATYDVSDFAVVVGIAAGTGVTDDQAKLLFTDGTTLVVVTDDDYTDEINPGDLVTYEVSSGEYALKPYTYSSDDGFDFGSSTTTDGAVTDDDGDNSDDIYFIVDGSNEFDIAEDAIIFVKDTSDTSDDDYSVVSGATLMGVTAASSIAVTAYVGNEDSSGFETVIMAYLTTSEDFTTGDYYYGYVMSAVSSINDDDEVVMKYSVWTGSETITLYAEESLSAIATKRDLIEYSLNTDGEIDVLTVETFGAAAVTASSSSYVTIAVQDTDEETDLAIDTTRYKLTDDTVYIYVDYTDNEAIDDGTVELALTEDAGDDYVIDNNNYDDVTIYYTNAKVIVDDDGEVLAILIDIAYDMGTDLYVGTQDNV